MTSLISTRIQLHYAIQFIAAAESALLPFAEDHSHTALSWNPELKLFISSPIPGNQTFYVALEPINLTSLILNSNRKEVASFALNQQTFDQGMNWLKIELAPFEVATGIIKPLTYPDDFPDHPLAHGAVFDAIDQSKRETLIRYYDLTLPILQAVTINHAGASPVRIWPHHFDMATLISLPTPEGKEARSIGVGLSPGDIGISEPYWYVTPWPDPPAEKLPALETKGTWQTEGWIGATLTASELGEINRGEIEEFTSSAIATFKRLLTS